MRVFLLLKWIIFNFMSEKLKDKRVQFGLDFFIGGISGIVSKTVVAPIERVKLLMQTQREN